MAYDHICTTHVHQHGGRDLTGIGSSIFPKEILGRQQKRRSAETFLQCGQRGEGCRQYDLEWPGIRAVTAQVVDKLPGLSAGFVQFPIGRNNRLTHSRIIRALALVEAGNTRECLALEELEGSPTA